MEEALYGRKTPKDALDYANGIVQKDLDRYLAPKRGVPVNWRAFVACYLALLVLGVVALYKWDTSVGFRTRVLRALGRKREVGIGDMVEGTRGGYFRSQWRAGFLFTLPWITGFVIFGAGPLLFSVLMSFCDYDVLSPPRFIGIENYQTLFFRDELAPKALLNTAFMLVRIPVAMVLGLLLAMLLNRAMRGMTLFRTLCYLPAVMPAVAGFLLWMWVFNPTNGPLNGVLRLMGIQGPNWLLDANWSKPSIVLMGLWGVGGSMVIWLAGLRSIPSDLYEAAALDGAGAWHRMRHITLPMLSPYIFFVAVMGLIDGFKIFDEAFIMTHGGPVNSTLFYVYHLFNNAFRFGHMGYASALAWALFVVIVVLTGLQMRLARRWVHYEGD
jgi:multiple sugar transport system permease protein